MIFLLAGLQLIWADMRHPGWKGAGLAGMVFAPSIPLLATGVGTLIRGGKWTLGLLLANSLLVALVLIVSRGSVIDFFKNVSKAGFFDPINLFLGIVPMVFEVLLIVEGLRALRRPNHSLDRPAAR